MPHPARRFHIKTCRNCEGQDPCLCSQNRNHAFVCCNYGKIDLGPLRHN